MTLAVSPRTLPASWRTVPTDDDRKRIQALADEALVAMRSGLHKALFDGRASVGSLHSASVQRLYLKSLVRGLVRWIAETQSQAAVRESAHHVADQDGPEAADVMRGRTRLRVEKVTCAILRTVASAMEDAA